MLGFVGRRNCKNPSGKFLPTNTMWSSEDGSAVIEFAAVMPVFVLITSGILSFGIYLGAAHSVQQLTADAARASVAGLTSGERDAIAREYVAVAAQRYPLIESDKLAVSSASEDGRYVITLKYDSSTLPIWSLKGLVPLPAQVIERRSIIGNGGQ